MRRKSTRRKVLLSTGAVISASIAGCADDPADDVNDVEPDDTDDVDVDDTEPDDDVDDEPDDEPDDDVDDEPDDNGIPADGTIQLRVMDDETIEPISGATVTLSGDPLDEELNEESDDEGYVEFTDLEFGEYIVRGEAEGYEPFEDEMTLDEDTTPYIIGSVPLEPEAENDEEEENDEVVDDDDENDEIDDDDEADDDDDEEAAG